MINGVIKKGSVVQAGKVLRPYNSVFEFSIGLERFGDNFSNSTLQVKESLKRTKVRLSSKKGDRFLTDNELIGLLEWLPDSGFSTTQKSVLRLTLLDRYLDE